MHFFECPFSFYARKNPKLPALILEKKEWTYLECNQIITSITSSLKDLGVKKGDRVAFFPTSTYPSPLLFFALYRLEAIACPINTYLPMETAFIKQLEQVNPSLFLYPDQMRPLKTSIRSRPFSALFFKTGSFQERQIFLQKESRGTYLFTSGTSSAPKIACLSIGNHYYSALGSNPYCSLEMGDRWHLSLPLYHVAGISILFRCFLKGAAVVLSEKAPSTKELLDLKITHLSYVPTQLQRLLMSDFHDVAVLSKQLKCLLIGGAPISDSLYKEGVEKGLKLHLTYGMTEMCSQICMQKEPHTFSFTQGHPLPYRELKLAPDGEVLVRGKTLFLGFLKGKEREDLTPLIKGGWYATKDLATFSLKAGLKILGRKDRLFISGGENIYPEEIEAAMLNFPNIIEARVEAHPDKEFGFRPLAYIVKREHFQKEALKEYLGSFLPKYKIPIEFRLSE